MAALGHSRTSAINGLTNHDADGHVENFNRAREALFTPITNSTIGQRFASIQHMHENPPPLTAPGETASTNAGEIREQGLQGRDSIFSHWTSTQMCNFFVTSSLLLVASEEQ